MNEDLISRQAAIDAIVNITVFNNSNLIKDTCKNFFLNDNGWLGGIKDSIEAIEALPSALQNVPETNVGEWIWMGDTGDSRWMCSVCKGKEKVPTIMGEPIVWEFCPNCGSRMLKGEEDGNQS